MKVLLQNTSPTDKKYIKEAICLKSQTDASGKGWKKIGSGKNKIVFKKGRIVVKFSKRGRGKHLCNEINKYFSTPKHYRKYFARIFAGDSKKIVQRHVPIKIKSRYSGREYMKFDILLNKLQVWDASLHHNISITNSGPVIYDFGC